MKLRLLALFFVLANAQMALGCEPEIRVGPSSAADKPRLIAGAQCAARYSNAGSASISNAENLGAGFVLQTMGDLNGCGPAEVDYVVQDCNSGRALIFGGLYGWWDTSETDRIPTGEEDSFFVTDADSYRLAERVKGAATAGSHMTLDEIRREASTVDIDFLVDATTTSLISINGYEFPLGCGCELYNGG
jgi:hypothetical protein